MGPDSSANKNFDVFYTPVSKFINRKNELAILADKVDWTYLEEVFAPHATLWGVRGSSIRLLIGLKRIAFLPQFLPLGYGEIFYQSLHRS